MSTHKNIDRVCIFITILAIVVTVLFMNGTSLGVVADDSVSMGYENRLFDDSYVHTIDIEIDDWESFLETATSEEYSAANVTIDGEKIKNVGIRGKGNTSLSTVAQLDSDRYSFKIEFDAYQSSTNYHGLDKLCLNNLIQDYTMMKDYLAYKLMGEFGADAPLVSFTYITVNGEDWGLYLAVEAVEDSFLERNNGTNYGNLYKPDTLSMGGGRGNGGGFDMKDIDFDELGMENPFERGSKDEGDESSEEGSEDSGDNESDKDGSKSSENKSGKDSSKSSENKSGKDSSKNSENKSGENNSKKSEKKSDDAKSMNFGKDSKKDFGRSSSKSSNGRSENNSEDKSGGKSADSTSEEKSMPDFAGGNFSGGDFTGGDFPGGDFSSADSSSGFPGGGFPGGDFASSESSNGFAGGGGPGGFGGFGGFGMGSGDVKLQYIDDDVDSYSTIFENAKTNIKTSDKNRLIKALKELSEGITEQDAEKIADAVDVDEVMRYMVVHNFLVNSDSYTGSMIHNYYLYEENGVLSMIPWDYNLAYGTFQGSDADSAVNDPIDTPLSITEGSTDRPMFSWITSNDEYLEMYHEYYQEFIDQFYTSGYLTDLIDSTYEMIHEYVEKDPTKFCTTEEFETAVSTIRSFVELRCQSIQGQLDGSIGSTDSAQAADPDALIDASSINISDMGSMGGGGGHGGGPGGDSDRGGFPGGGNFGSESKGDSDSSSESKGNSGFPGGFSGRTSDDAGSEESSDSSDSEMPGNPFGGDMPGDFSGGDMPGGFGGDESDSGSSSDGFSGFSGGGMPGDFSGGNMPEGFGGGDMPSFGGMQGSSISAENYIYLGVCVAVLLAAILIAYKYKARK